MVKKASELSLTLEPNLKGGRDTVRVYNILEKDELCGAGRLFGISVIPPGGSIGYHMHTGDFEVYYFLEGSARVNDNGNICTLGPGDMMRCAEGESHGIENIGDTDLRYVAAILYTGGAGQK